MLVIGTCTYGEFFEKSKVNSILKGDTTSGLSAPLMKIFILQIESNATLSSVTRVKPFIYHMSRFSTTATI